MSFANWSKNPNCERRDEFDQLHGRVFYFLNRHLKPNKDGSLHEITISYNNGFGENASRPSRPLASRRRHDINKGYWPGTPLYPLDEEDEEEARKELLAATKISQVKVDENLQITTNDTSADWLLFEERKNTITLFIQERSVLFKVLKTFTETILQKCHDIGLEELTSYCTESFKKFKRRLKKAPLYISPCSQDFKE